MKEFNIVGQMRKKVTVGKLIPMTFKKYSRDPNAKYFIHQYKMAEDEDDKNLLSLLNAMITSNRPVTILTRKIFEEIVAADKNWKNERKLNTKQYTFFLTAIKNLGIFQVVHMFTKSAPMIIRIVQPELRAMMDMSSEDEQKLLVHCEEFRIKKDSAQKSAEPIVQPGIIPKPPKPSKATIENLNKMAAELRERAAELPPEATWFNEPAKDISKATPSKAVYEIDGEEVEHNIDNLRAEMMKEDCTALGDDNPYEDLLEDDIKTRI